MSLTSWLRNLLGTDKPQADEPPAPAAVPEPVPTRKSRPLPEAKETAKSLILSGQAPQGLEFQNISLADEKSEFRLPEGLRCFGLDVSNTGITAVPADISIESKLSLSGCAALVELPRGLKTGSLVLNGCVGLTALPEDLSVNFLNIDDCANLREWPDSARVELGSVSARRCANLERLPNSLRNLTNLDISGCRKIQSLPPGLEISGWLDVADTGIESLPESLVAVQLRWRGVLVSLQIAFFPETLSVEEILNEPNAEVRRVMIERRGLESFFREAKAAVVDEDSDAGGPRRLLKVALPGDEDLVCISMTCPSTGRHYVVRVPPHIRTCHAAVAWTAGFDNPDDYRPLVET